MLFLADFLEAITTTITTVSVELGSSALAMFDGAFTDGLGAISSLGVMAGIVIGLGLLGGLLAWAQSKI
jgi:hypothetical protein